MEIKHEGLTVKGGNPFFSWKCGLDLDPCDFTEKMRLLSMRSEMNNQHVGRQNQSVSLRFYILLHGRGLESSSYVCILLDHSLCEVQVLPQFVI